MAHFPSSCFLTSSSFLSFLPCFFNSALFSFPNCFSACCQGCFCRSVISRLCAVIVTANYVAFLLHLYHRMVSAVFSCHLSQAAFCRFASLFVRLTFFYFLFNFMPCSPYTYLISLMVTFLCYRPPPSPVSCFSFLLREREAL